MTEGLSFKTSSNTGEEELSVENILKRVSEIILWRYYIGSNFELNQAYCAPYRPDGNPSFSLRYDSRDRLMYKDFGRPGVYGDIFNYLQMVERITFIEALEKVNDDFGLGLINTTNTVVLKEKDRQKRIAEKKKVTQKDIDSLLKFENIFKERSQSAILIQAITRSWREKDLIYWSTYGISQETLKKYYVFPCDKVFKNKVLIYTDSPNNPCYVYYFPKSKHVKCYMPKSNNIRFFGNVNNLEDIQGYYQCDVKGGEKENKLLILTKSQKDVMLLREYGIDSMAIHGENHRFEDDFIRHIKKYYGRIISLYDRDRAGILGARKLWKEHGIKAFFINKMWHCKDISDMFMTYGNDVVKDFLLSLIKKS